MLQGGSLAAPLRAAVGRLPFRPPLELQLEMGEGSFRPFALDRADKRRGLAKAVLREHGRPFPRREGGGSPSRTGDGAARALAP
jgi:hypothetical protein